MRIVIDTREQCPYEFESPTTRATLEMGDYSIMGLEAQIAVERKTLDDLITCLTSDRGRFKKELHRGRALNYFCLIVEGSLSDLANGRYRSNMLPKSAVQSLIAFSVRYKLPVWFAESREYGQRLTESLLLKYGKEIEKQARCLNEAA